MNIKCSYLFLKVFTCVQLSLAPKSFSAESSFCGQRENVFPGDELAMLLYVIAGRIAIV